MDVGVKAEAKIAEHEAQIKDHKSAILAHEAEVTRLRAFLSTYRELADGEATNGGGTVARPEIAPPPREKGKRGPNGSPPDQIAVQAEALMVAKGKPLTRSELIPLIEEHGLTIGGTDKAKNLGTLLWRSGKFESTGEGYWPKGVQRPII